MHDNSAAFGTEDEQRRHLALANGARELDKDLGAIVEGAQRPPQRRVALDSDRGRGLGDGVLPA
jgi:hypothetical protein